MKAALPLVLSFIACTTTVTPGDRVLNGCPAGVVCGTEAPTGLSFSGAKKSNGFFETDATVKGFAVGGLQRITIVGCDDCMIFAEISGPFLIESDETTAYDVVATGEGEGQMIFTNDHGELLDTLSIHAAEARMELSAPTTYMQKTDLVLFAGNEGVLEARLVSATNETLVDQRLTVQAAPAGVGLKSDYDRLRVTAAAAGTFELGFLLHDGRTLRRSVDAVSELESFGPTKLSDSGLCAHAGNQGREVVGVKASFTAAGPIKIAQAPFFDNCVILNATESEGQGEITIDFGGGRSVTLVVPVVDGKPIVTR